MSLPTIESLANGTEIEDGFRELLLNSKRETLMAILEHEDVEKHFAIVLSLIEFPGYMSSRLLSHPCVVFPKLHESAIQIMNELVAEESDRRKLQFKPNIHIRVSTLFDNPKTFRTRIPVDSTDKDKFFAISGTIVKATKPKLLQVFKTFECSTCKAVLKQKANRRRHYVFSKPFSCPTCSTSKLRPILTEDVRRKQVIDYQEVTLQEGFDSSQQQDTSVRRSIPIIMEHDLIESCNPGDDIVVTGTLYVRWKAFRPDSDLEAELVFRANHVVVLNESETLMDNMEESTTWVANFWRSFDSNPLEGRNTLLKSICPDVHGMYLVKVAIAMVIAGGVEKTLNGSRTRGQIHILLSGSPGTAKSKLLRNVMKITRRSVFTNGSGTTNAGLTAAAVKEDGQWTLAAGALVLAHRGYCMIDEFLLVKESEKAGLYEIMEQQTVSIAKAGIVCRLPAETTVLASMNPKLLHYDNTKSLEDNLGLTSAMLSRFDILLNVTDRKNGAWDALLTRFILDQEEAMENPSGSGILKTEEVKQYFATVRNCKPEMTQPAYKILTEYFKIQRSFEGDTDCRRTVRMLEALVRASEAHAKIMNHQQVKVMDAVFAVSIIDLGMHSSALWPVESILHIHFPEDPLQEYHTQAQSVLTTLGLHDIWTEEMAYLELLLTR